MFNFSKELALAGAIACQTAYKDASEIPHEMHVFGNGLEQAIAMPFDGVYAGPGKLWIIAFRGTIGKISDWLYNFKIEKAPFVIENGEKTVYVHKGFCDKWDLVADPVTSFVDALPEEDVVLFVGHSQGGPVADMAAASVPKERVYAVYTYGQPMFTDSAGRAEFEEHFGDKYMRVVHDLDIVARVPFDCAVDQYVHFGLLAQLGQDGGITFPAYMTHEDWHFEREVEEHYIDSYVACLQKS